MEWQRVSMLMLQFAEGLAIERRRFAQKKRAATAIHPSFSNVVFVTYHTTHRTSDIIVSMTMRCI